MAEDKPKVGGMMVEEGPWGVPAADSAANQSIRDVVGNKSDVRSDTASQASLVAVLRQTLYQAGIVERHHHSGERWFGAAASASGETHIADRIGAGAATAEAGPLVVTAGNDDWGTWTQILGSTDTPADGGSATHFDLHRLVVRAAGDAAQEYFIQISLQENPPNDDPGPSDAYTEIEIISAGVGALATIAPIDLQAPRATAGTKVWMRTRAPNQNTSTLSITIGIHEYSE